VTPALMRGFESTGCGADQGADLPRRWRPNGPAQLLPSRERLPLRAPLLPPGTVPAPADLDIQAGLAELEEKMPGAMAYMEPDDPGITPPTRSTSRWSCLVK
jgi:hypothetical protein